MHFCQPPSGGFEIGFSQARGLESIDKPHKWGSGIKYDSTNPGVNAWAIKKKEDRSSCTSERLEPRLTR